jgi:hypothetical protein
MSVDAPTATAHPLRLAQALFAGLASAGLIAVSARQLYRYPQVLLSQQAPVLTWLAPITVAFMLTLPAAIVATRPALGRAGWSLVAAGLGVSTLVIQTELVGTRGEADLVWLVVVIAGLAGALGAVMVAAEQAGTAERIAIAAGVAFGFAAQRYDLWLYQLGPSPSTTTRMLPFYLAVAAALAAAAIAFTRPRTTGTIDAPPQALATFGPVLIAVAVAGMIQLGHYLRQAVVEEFRLSPDGLASQRRIDTVSAFAEFSAIALAAVAGLILFWLGWRRGKADLARWVVLGFALGGPSLTLVIGFQSGGTAGVTWAALTALGCAAAGVALAWYADRLFPWDALGVAVTALGMIVGSVAYRVGPPTAGVAYLMITGGFALALAAGLTRAVRTTTATTATKGLAVGQAAISLALGFVALLATADAIEPATWILLVSNGFDGFQLGAPITSLVAAGILVVLFGFRRTVDRVRREIMEQAKEPPR